MFPSISNQRRIQAVQNIVNTHAIKNPSTYCVIERLKLRLYKTNSVLSNGNLLQTNGTATGGPNSCLYHDIVVA